MYGLEEGVMPKWCARPHRLCRARDLLEFNVNSGPAAPTAPPGPAPWSARSPPSGKGASGSVLRSHAA